MNDIRVGTGAPIATPTHDDLYPTYADSLRITTQTSLFTYPPGTSTETYTDRTFPDRMPDPLPNRAWAESLCRQFGITDPVSLDACVVDIANTGTADFMAASVVAQSLSASFRLGGSGATLGIAKPGDVSTVSFAGTAGQKLYVDVVSSTLPDACGVLSLKDPAGHVLATGCVIGGKGGIDAVVLPATGLYTVAVDPPGAATGDVTLRLISATDQQAGLSLDWPEVSLAITAAGAVGRLTFPGRAGQVIFVDVPSSTLKDQCGVTSVRDPADHVLSTGCVIGGKGYVDRTVLPTTGTYTVVVDPSDTSTGLISVRLIEAIDQQGTISVNGPEVTATIVKAGAVARFTFPGTAGQWVYVDIPLSTVKDACGVLLLRDPAGTVLSTGCVIGGKGLVDRTMLAQTGT